MADRFVYVKKTERKALMEKYGVSDALMSACMHFKTNSVTARNIRREAVNFRGAIPFV